MTDRFDEAAAALVSVDEANENELFVHGAGLAEWCYSRANAEEVAAGARVALAALLREEAARAFWRGVCAERASTAAGSAAGYAEDADAMAEVLPPFAAASYRDAARLDAEAAEFRRWAEEGA